MRRDAIGWLAVAAAAALFAANLFGRLSHPLMWADEAETAMFAEHVLAYGYPKVHGERNVVYQFGPNIAVGVKEGLDAYIGTTWGHFYFALPGLLWARACDDPYARTLRMRLPFALAGAAGVALWLSAVLPVFAGEPRRARRFGAAFLLLAGLSVSLVLHLREVRYYALVVLLGGAIARVHLGYAVYARTSFRRWAVSLAVLLVLLFHTFFQAFFAFALLLACERAWAIRRGEGRWRDLAPFAAAALAVAPALVFFETLTTARAFAASFAFGPADAAANLAAVALHFLRHEFLAPALLARAGVLASGAGAPAERRVAARLAGFGLGYALLGCLNPLALERYFVVLSPLVSGLFLLDAAALIRLASAAGARRGRPRAGGLAAAGLAALALAAHPQVVADARGRLAELATPYRGPLDFAIPYLRQRFPHPEDLVIATNYEEYSFMYYLGSHTIVGLALANLSRDRALEPDVVVPRRHWPRSLVELGPWLRAGEWEEVRFPVRDLHQNTVPELSPSRFVPDPHHWVTAATDDPEEELVIYLRVSSSKRTGTSSRP